MGGRGRVSRSLDGWRCRVPCPPPPAPPYRTWDLDTLIYLPRRDLDTLPLPSASGHGTWIPYPLLTPLLTSGGHHWGPIHLRTYPFPPPHYQPVADLRGARETRPFPGGPNSFNFMQFLGKLGKILCWRPPPQRVGEPTSGKSWIRHCKQY